MLNGINVILELDAVSYDALLLGVEEYKGSALREAISKVLQAHHASWCFPWLTYRVSGAITKKLGRLNEAAQRLLDYYSIYVSLGEGPDAQIVDLLLGEVGAYTKLFLLSPFPSLGEALWHNSLKHLREAFREEDTGRLRGLAARLLDTLIRAGEEQGAKQRLSRLVEGLCEAVGDNKRLEDILEVIGAEINVMYAPRSTHYERVAVVLPRLHTRLVVSMVAEKLCHLLGNPRMVKLWMPPVAEEELRVIQGEFEKGLRKAGCKAQIELMHYNVGKDADIKAEMQRLLGEVCSGNSPAALVIVLDAPKVLLVTLLYVLEDMRCDNVSLLVATPRISVKRGQQGVHVTGVPLEIVKVV